MPPFHHSRWLALAAALPATAGAQERPAAAPVTALPEIVVTGRGLDLPPAAPAYGVSEIDRQDLTGAASGRIDAVLAGAAGVQQFRRSDSRSSNPSAQGITLRALGGNATSRTLLLLDGVPQADPFFGYVPLGAIDPGLLAGGRITRGGGAGAFAAGAVAGTIELASAGPAELGLAQATALVNDRGETELAGSLAPRLGSGFAVLSGRWDRGQGFWTTPVDQRVPASVRARFETWSAGLRIVALLAPAVELQAKISAFNDARVLRFAGANTGISGQDASLRVVGRRPWSFEALGYVQARDFHNVVVSSNPPYRPTLDQSATPSTGLGGMVEVRPPVGGGHVLRLGLDARQAQGSGREGRLVPSLQRRSAGGTNSDVGLYAEDDWALGRLVLTGGARLDRWSVVQGRFRALDAAGAVVSDLAFPDRSGAASSFRAGALVRVGSTLALRGAAYSNIRQPTLNELYRSFVVGTVTTLRNPALGNERLVGLEGGVDWKPASGIRLSLTAFDNSVRHAIANVTVDGVTRRRQNVDAVHVRGIEASGDLRFGLVSLDGSLAFSDARVRAPGQAYNGLRPAQTACFAANATLAYAPGPGWRLALTLRHIGAQFEDDLETDTLPAATTLDAFAEVPLRKGLTLILRGENLTDAMVLTRNQGGSIDLGAPRTVWAGLRARIG